MSRSWIPSQLETFPGIPGRLTTSQCFLFECNWRPLSPAILPLHLCFVSCHCIKTKGEIYQNQTLMACILTHAGNMLLVLPKPKYYIYRIKYLPECPIIALHLNTNNTTLWQTSIIIFSRSCLLLLESLCFFLFPLQCSPLWGWLDRRGQSLNI